MLCACAARYQLADVDIERAKSDADGVERLYVLPSNRTILLYYRSEGDFAQIGREIDQRAERRKLTFVLGRNTEGVIVGEELSNGARQLFVCFDPECTGPEAAYGFVQTEDGRYRLNHVPERDSYNVPRVHRDCVLKKRRMKKDHMKSLSEANKVFLLKKKRRKKTKVRTVFLEVKIRNRKFTRGRRRRERGRPD
jgi:hypothetical protein